jgi:hypothetical protein
MRASGMQGVMPEMDLCNREMGIESDFPEKAIGI